MGNGLHIPLLPQSFASDLLSPVVDADHIGHQLMDHIFLAGTGQLYGIIDPGNIQGLMILDHIQEFLYNADRQLHPLLLPGNLEPGCPGGDFYTNLLLNEFYILIKIPEKSHQCLYAANVHYLLMQRALQTRNPPIVSQLSAAARYLPVLQYKPGQSVSLLLSYRI